MHTLKSYFTIPCKRPSCSNIVNPFLTPPTSLSSQMGQLLTNASIKHKSHFKTGPANRSQICPLWCAIWCYVVICPPRALADLEPGLFLSSTLYHVTLYSTLLHWITVPLNTTCVIRGLSSSQSTHYHATHPGDHPIFSQILTTHHNLYRTKLYLG